MKDPTLCQLFLEAAGQARERAMFLVRHEGTYTPVTGRQIQQAVRETCAGLQHLGIEPGDRVALLSENRLQWAQADLATLGRRAIVVPIYPTLLPGQIRELLQDCRPKAIFCSSRDQADKIAQIRGDVTSLKHVICFDGSGGSETVSLEQLQALGRDHLRRSGDDLDRQVALADLDEVATILYTSGTTGTPKGVMLTHRNIVFNVLRGLELLPVLPGARCLSFLPLSHIFERTCGYYAMMRAGATIAYADSIEALRENMREVRPTIMVCVPRLFEKIYAGMLARAVEGSPFGRGIFHWVQRIAVGYTDQVVSCGGPSPVMRCQHQVADRLVFRKLRQATGGQLRYFVSGGAPLPQEIAEFFHAAGVPILEGYGLTETSPVITVNTFERFRPGTVGPAMPGVEVRIASDGEILTRSPSVMKGYYNKPEATARALKNGWFHTGDVGKLDQHGFLRVTDRKKDLIVTAGGKNIAPQAIEGELTADRLIDIAALIGDRRQYMVALIIPNFENLRSWARHKEVDFEHDSDLVQSPTVYQRIQRTIDEVNQTRASYEQIKRFCILDHEFSVSSGELTPTLKLKRSFVQRKYAELVEGLYTRAD